jgi:ribosomal-protein-alanine acetyltransferase
MWQLRVAGPDDLGAIMAIETSTFTTDAWSRESMQSELRNPNSYYVAAVPLEGPERIDGYAGMLGLGNEGDIQTIAVVETARGKGLGRMLMQALISHARQGGARELFLEVRADNPVAHALYDSLGFADIAVRPRYYQPDDVDAIVMRLGIVPLGLSPAVGS